LNITIHQPECLPWMGFFSKLKQVDKVVLLDNVQFKKGYFENRNRVRTKDGWQYINIPVLTKGRHKQNIKDVEISYNDPKWRDVAYKGFFYNYSKAPYWKEHAAFIEELFKKDFRFIMDFNLMAIEYLNNALGLTCELVMASSLGVEGKGPQFLVDICKSVGASAYLSGASGRSYIPDGFFKNNGIEITFQDFKHPVYKQQYPNFVDGMTIFDLLLNCGSEAFNYI